MFPFSSPHLSITLPLATKTLVRAHTQCFQCGHSLCHWAHIDSRTVCSDLITQAAYKIPHQPIITLWATQATEGCLTSHLKHKALSALDHPPECPNPWRLDFFFLFQLPTNSSFCTLDLQSTYKSSFWPTVFISVWSRILSKVTFFVSFFFFPSSLQPPLWLWVKRKDL